MNTNSFHRRFDKKDSHLISINFLQRKTLQELVRLAHENGIPLRFKTSRRRLILDLIRCYLTMGKYVTIEGILELSGQQGILRSLVVNFKPGWGSVRVSAFLVRKYQLKTGLKLTGYVRIRNEIDRELLLDELLTIEGISAAQWNEKKDFEKLTPLFPHRRIVLESGIAPTESARAMDIIAPLGMGQRGLIVAPPGAGKTLLLKDIAKGIRDNHPDIHLILLFINERPEEVTDLRHNISAEILSATFDESILYHIQVCELAFERAKRLAEHGKNVVILLDSITRMTRGYRVFQTAEKKTMSGEAERKTLDRLRKFFRTARNLAEGGSLTILATASIETENKTDELIFEAFKIAGNMEVHLDRNIAEHRVFPAIHIAKSGTCKEELLYHPQEYQRVVFLRRQLAKVSAVEAMEILSRNIKATQDNAELLLTGLRGI